MNGTPKAIAEFFAGIGLMRIGLENTGWRLAFASDIDEEKKQVYGDHSGDTGEFVVGDVHDLKPSEVPTVGLATASFSCKDPSLAAARHRRHARGFAGRGKHGTQLTTRQSRHGP
jgi:DNA (cytosine-5)-methyltransferase 1